MQRLAASCRTESNCPRRSRSNLAVMQRSVPAKQKAEIGKQKWGPLDYRDSGDAVGLAPALEDEEAPLLIPGAGGDAAGAVEAVEKCIPVGGQPAVEGKAKAAFG